MTPPSRANEVSTAFDALMASGGGDGPESGTVALYELMTGAGGTWASGGRTYTMPSYASSCVGTAWGAACFRDGALPIVIHFADICQHDGPPGDCDDYVGISPPPATWTQAIDAMRARGARYVGVNASSGPACATVTAPGGCSTPGTCGSSPCWFMRQTASQTGSVDVGGAELVYDLPSDTTSTQTFSDTIVGAIHTIATRVPLDVTTRVRGDSTDPEQIDERMFVASVAPSAFYGVVPGTRVTFRITFRNDFFVGETHVALFRAHIDVTSGSTVLDTRDVFVVVPAIHGTLG
jgi:hypothetical protein